MTAPITDAELDAIVARAEAATAGPWAQLIDRSASQLIVMPAGRPGTIGAITGANYDADGLFIALARTDVPRLAAELRRAREALHAALLPAVASQETRDAAIRAEEREAIVAMVEDFSWILPLDDDAVMNEHSDDVAEEVCKQIAAAIRARASQLLTGERYRGS